jgi:salicylate hydroxylase
LIKHLGYEEIRRERAETLVNLASASGRALHLGQGKDREERDKQFQQLRESGGKAEVPDKWADGDVQKLMYGFDCEEVTRDKFDEIYGSLREGVEVGAGQA